MSGKSDTTTTAAPENAAATADEDEKIARDIFRKKLKAGQLEDREVELKMPQQAGPQVAVQMMAIAFLLLDDAGPAWLPVEAIGWWGLWLAALLTLVTGWDYLQAGLRHMLQEPAGPARVGGRRAGAGS